VSDKVLKCERETRFMGRMNCRDFFKCTEKECPVYGTTDFRCWLVSGTHCRNEIQGKFIEKMEMCLGCEVFELNMDVSAMKATISTLNEQFAEFRRIVQDRDSELESMSLELALSLAEVFEALKKISAGDPSVRTPETSNVELITKLKHMVNMTAENIGEIVDYSHEFAIGLAEHFDVLHRVSKGDLDARVTGGSRVDLLESLKEVTNETIENISKEISRRVEAEENLIKEKNLSDSAISSLPCIFFLIDEHGRTLRWNRNLEAVTGYSSEEIGKMSPADFFDAEEEKLMREKIREVFIKGQSTLEVHLTSKDGKKTPYLLTDLRFRSNGKNYLVGVGIDITDKKLTENALREKEEREALILSHLPMAFYTARPSGNLDCIWVSEQIDRISGFPPEEFGKNPQLWISRIHPDDRDKVLNEFNSISKKNTIVTDYRWQCADGSYNWFRDQAVLIRGEKGEPVEIVGAMLDITDRKRTEEALRSLSLSDELTGLYNRRGFFTLAEQQLRIANRMKKRMLLLFADLDGLKWINDSMGHNEGDLALVEVSDILKKTFRESDFVARIGGDEFVVLAMETEEVTAEVLRRRLEENLKAHNTSRNRRYNLSISAGISRCDPENRCSIDELISRADRSMYRHKRKKSRRPIIKNGVSFSILQ
jgi:diguanylate cyclase (GGDEF)-like protein/PAS domain S-box-containing protein